MKKHAYLIIAHNEFYILERLLKLIDDERNDIYLHIDKKVKDFDFDYFKQIIKRANLYFTSRIDVIWSDYSQIKCELLLLKEATHQKYDYYHLISGVDLPLKNQDEIHTFFDNCGHKDFVHFHNHKIASNNSLDRVKYYHLFLKNIRSKNRYKRFLSNKLHNLFIKIQKTVHYNRIKGQEKIFKYGANWFSITDELARYVLSKEAFIHKHFKHTSCADELFLQTIVYNSKYYQNLYNYQDDDYTSIMRYIDWERGNPYTFQKNDFEELMNSNMLFARKFSCNVDQEIVDKIYHKVKE